MQVGLICKNYHIFINYHTFKYDICKLYFEMLCITRIIKEELNRSSTIAFFYEKNKRKIIICFPHSYVIAMILVIFLGPKSP